MPMAMPNERVLLQLGARDSADRRAECDEQDAKQINGQRRRHQRPPLRGSPFALALLRGTLLGLAALSR